MKSIFLKKATCFFLLLLTFTLIACSAEVAQSSVEQSGGDTEAPSVENEVTNNPNPRLVINSFYDLNKKSNEQLSHEGDGTYSGLELDFRSLCTLGVKDLKTTTVYYPRLKRLGDGSFILFYQEGEHGDSVFYIKSQDLSEWSEPTELFIHNEEKDIKYATCDAVVLDNGEILAVCSYREGSTYDINPHLNGIVMKSSSDNGKSWSEQKVIYVGTTWEPYPMQLSSGEVQVYFTNTTCYYREAVADASTGTAMIRSTDRGRTWTGNLSVPYSAQIVSQTKTRVSAGTQLFSDQMPVGIEMLGSKKIMLALETRLDKNGSYRITLSFSDDNWKKGLGANEEGPSEKIKNAWTGAAPYLRQFVSGEIMCAYTRQNKLAYRMIDSTGKKYSKEDLMPFDGISNSYWGSLELVGSHSVVGIGETFNKVTVTRTENTLNLGVLNLNHSITAEKLSFDSDDRLGAWNGNDESIFIGSVSQAQACVRSGHDSENVYFLIERLDDYLSDRGDGVTLYFGDRQSSGYYRIVVGSDGIESFDKNDGGKFSDAGVSDVECTFRVNGTVGSDEDKDVGYVAEIKIPKSKIESFGNSLCVNLMLSNTDKGERYDRDLLDGTEVNDRSSWIAVRYK